MRQILIVEDDVIIAEDIKSKLCKLNYSVTDIVYNGDNIFDSIHIKEPDLILLDIHLKGTKTGIDLGHIINEKYKLLFMYITSFSDNHTIKEFKKMNPCGYLRKPFSLNDLNVQLEMAFYIIDRFKFKQFPGLEAINSNLDKAITKTEYKMILDIKEGMTNEEISLKKIVSVNTVKSHIRNIYSKCKSKNFEAS